MTLSLSLESILCFTEWIKQKSGQGESQISLCLHHCVSRNMLGVSMPPWDASRADDLTLVACPLPHNRNHTLATWATSRNLQYHMGKAATLGLRSWPLHLQTDQSCLSYMPCCPSSGPCNAPLYPVFAFFVCPCSGFNCAAGHFLGISREGTKDTTKRWFYPSLSWQTNEFIGVTYGVRCAQTLRQAHHWEAHSKMGGDSWKMHFCSFLQNLWRAPLKHLLECLLYMWPWRQALWVS